MLPLKEATTTLLDASDPDPVEIVNPEGDSDFLLVCEHAGRAVPATLGDLGIAATEMDRHIAYDIGAEGLARKLSALLDAPLVLQRYSRLVIDCNRPLTATDSIPETSDGTTIPTNLNLTASARRVRADEIHRPFHDAIGRLLDLRQRGELSTILATIHSFVPRFGGKDRRWQLGVCFNRDGVFARQLMKAFQANNPSIVAAHNEPYCVDDESDFSIPVHGERRGLPHVLLEVRHDQIADEAGQASWADLLARALSQAASARAAKGPAHVA
jgi:predicted N-formylglutamate amidohydrolase